MKKEDLVALGLTEEVIQKVIDLGKADLNGYVPKTRLDEVITDRDNLKTELATRDKQLKDLEKNVEGNEELQTQIKDLQKLNKESTEKYEAQISKMKTDFAVEKSLKDFEAKNIKAVIPFLNLEKVEFEEDGSIKGLKEQIETLKKSEDTSFLFNIKETPQVQKQMSGVSPVQEKKETTAPVSGGNLTYSQMMAMKNN